MTLAIVSKASALPSIEKARDLLAHCRSVHEVKKIKAVAEAVKSCEMSEDAAREAQSIVLMAKARIGELTAGVEGEKGRGGARSRGVDKDSRAERLKSEGVSIREAKECERLAEMQKSGDLDRVIKSGAKVTIASAVSMAKLEPKQRSEAIAKLGDVADLAKAVAAVREPVVRRERVETWDEDVALLAVTDAIEKSMREWRGPNFKPLMSQLRLLINQMEKIDANR